MKKNIYKLVTQALSDKYTQFLIDICNIETNSLDKDSINKLVDYIIDFEKESGYTFKRQSFEKAGDCLSISLTNSENLPYIALSAHMDTVYNKGVFGYPPVKKDNDFLYGPGVSDCKGGIAVGLLVMAALKQIGFKNCNLKLILQSDEEVSSSLSDKQTIKFICNEAKGCDAFFNLETRRPGKVTLERNGILNARFEIFGSSAHAKDKQLGANAIKEAAFKIIELENYSQNPEISFNCGTIKGGTARNVVPNYCTFDVDCRMRTKEGYKEAVHFLETLSKNSHVPGTKAMLSFISSRDPMILTDKNIELFNKLKAVSEKYGFGTLEAFFSAGGSDAAYTTAYGIPTLDSLGIIGEKYHSSAERASISSIAQSAELLLLYILEYYS